MSKCHFPVGCARRGEGGDQIQGRWWYKEVAEVERK